MSRLVSEEPDDLDPIDLDRLAIDGEYRRAVMLRLRNEAQAKASTESMPTEDEPQSRDT